MAVVQLRARIQGRSSKFKIDATRKESIKVEKLDIEGLFGINYEPEEVPGSFKLPKTVSPEAAHILYLLRKAFRIYVRMMMRINALSQPNKKVIEIDSSCSVSNSSEDTDEKRGAQTYSRSTHRIITTIWKGIKKGYFKKKVAERAKK